MIARLTGMMLLLAGALSAGQLPELAQQYRQRLGGALDELSMRVEEFRAAAESAGLSIEEALQQYQAAGGAFLPEQGRNAERMMARRNTLLDQKARMDTGSLIARAQILLLEADPALREGALEDFKPALPLTREGIAMAATGGALGLILNALGVFTFRRLRGRQHQSSSAR